MTEENSEQPVFEIIEDDTDPRPTSGLKKISYLFAGTVFLLAMLITIFYNLQHPPKNFPTNQPFVVESGSSLREIITLAKNEGLVRSELALYIEIMLNHKDTPIKASTYYFEKPLSVSELATELTIGGKRTDLIRFTHFEGETVEQLAKRAQATLIDFNADVFMELAKSSEGVLFPETYHIPSNYSEQEFFTLVTNTFEEKISHLESKINSSDLTLKEIIILASIIEREAKSLESKRMVSGILQNRLKIGMALQVDASIGYILDKPLSELTPEDLELDSPYNTYLYPGLPPTAICNPGLDAIEAVLEPETSDYLFYITGTDGNFYYAKDFDEHRRNVAKYLR